MNTTRSGSGSGLSLRAPRSALRALDRRHFLRVGALSVGVSLSGWLAPLARAAANDPKRKRSCILLWMNGGPSTIDLFDLKPGHENGGPFKEIATAAPGVRISEHLPKVAERMRHVSLVRSMTSKEGDHGLATFLAHTGYSSRGPIQYPTFGSIVAKELGADDAALPNFVSVAPFRAFSNAAHGPGFLGPRYAPLVVGESVLGGPATDPDRALQVEDLALPGGVKAARFDARMELAAELQREFAAARPDPVARSHQTAYDRAASGGVTAIATFDANWEYSLDGGTSWLPVPHSSASSVGFMKSSVRGGASSPLRCDVVPEPSQTPRE